MIPYSTVIFDLDGTLLDTLQDLCDSTNYALALYNMPARSLDEIRRFVGNGVGLLIHRAVPEGTPDDLEAQCLADFRAHYLLNMEHRTAPYAGVLELLDGLNKAGIKLAVVSNKFDGAVKGLCQTYFGDRVKVAIGESQGVARKPARPQRRPALSFGKLGLPGHQLPPPAGRPAHPLLPCRPAGPAHRCSKLTNQAILPAAISKHNRKFAKKEGFFKSGGVYRVKAEIC